MDERSLDAIYRYSSKRIAEVSLAKKRYLYESVDWSDRLIGLKGARGTGKTTLLLQKIRESGDERKRTLYVSLDNVWLDAREVCDLAEYHGAHGGTRLVIDEIHYLANWQALLKTLNDSFPDLKVAYTGSSVLRLRAKEGDLSRRLTDYELKGMSFREYLGFEGLCDREPIALDDILENHVGVAEEIVSECKVLVAFEKYFRTGYYPFYLESEARYPQRLLQVINQVLESDWPSVEDVSNVTVRRARKMLRILAARPPQTPKMQDLYAQLETDHKNGMKIMKALEDAELLRFLESSGENLKALSRTEKIYCDNPNLMYALCPDANVGTAREAYFHNQVGMSHEVRYPKHGDFEVDGRFLFEVGGKGKSFEQIKDIPGSFLAVDGTEVGRGNRIPLWLFGFLY